MAPHILSRSSALLAVLSLQLFGSPAVVSAAPEIARGPYLQIATPDAVTIRWRTDEATESRVRYGSAPDQLDHDVLVDHLASDHEVRIEGLSAATRYYYSIGTATGTLAGGDDMHFTTSPPSGTPTPTRIWALGDAGTGGSRQRSTRDAYAEITGDRRTDVILMLGDNAYPDGKDHEYQEAVFDMYPNYLKTTAFWPVRGNHDRMNSGNIDYYDIFSLPTGDQTGGLASGTEAYYSFDYANIHFVALDSEGSDRSPQGAMATWLQGDLAATDQTWIIAYWHHPPYTHGSHNSSDLSDSDGRLRDMRENFLPLLEQAGVDLVLTGHSHSYERSFMVHGYYGTTSSLDTAMIVDDGDGRVDGDGPYEKPTPGHDADEGAVYIVAGSSGKINSGSLDHPIMVSSIMELGSVAIDVDGLRLDARFINGDGAVRDSFTLIKDDATPVLLARFEVGVQDANIEIRWELGHAASFTDLSLERARSSRGPWAAVGFEWPVEPGLQTVVDGDVEPGETYFYRLRATMRSGEDALFGPLEATAGVPIERFALQSVAPNPTRGATRIDYTVAQAADVVLTIVDVQGREIARLVEGFHRPGRHQAVWTGETALGAAPAGVYFVRGRAGATRVVERLILAR